MSWGVALRNAVGLGLGGIPSLRKSGPYPKISFDFTKGTLDPLITFTRASSATYFDSAGVLQTAGNNVARFDYNPSTLAARGLLIEEQRTNSLRNNTMVGAVAGTPGTAPTNWVVPGTINGLTQQIVGTGTEKGITYVDVRYSGTTTTTGSHGISFEAANQIAAASGQTWTRSAWFKIAAGSTANLTSLTHNTQGRNAANTAFTETFSTDIAPSLTGTLTRFSTASTLADANTAFARSQIQYFYNSGVAIDLTLRIGLPQFEQGAFATSVIPTSTTALTRSADVAAITGTNFTNWFNSIEGTLVVNATVTATTTDGTTRVLASIGDSSTFNETIYLARASSSANITANVIDGGVAQWASNTLGSATANTPFKTSMAYKLNDLGGSFNGAAAVTDSVATIPTVNSLSLGNGSWSGATNYINGYLQSFAYYPTRLRNGTLQALTS